MPWGLFVCDASNSVANSVSIPVELTAEFDALRPLVPEAYHIYLDVFSKRKGTMLKLEEKGKTKSRF